MEAAALLAGAKRRAAWCGVTRTARDAAGVSVGAWRTPATRIGRRADKAIRLGAVSV